MKHSSAAYQPEPQEEVAGLRVSPSSAADGNPGLFLAGVAGLLRETVQRFETISGGVTDAVMAQSGKADRDLIVTLQAFDRLQQEFVAVADVLTRYSCALDSIPASAGRLAKFEAEVIAAIAVSDLKQRLLHHLQRDRANEIEPAPSGDKEF